jgi:hypothetical protein
VSGRETSLVTLPPAVGHEGARGDASITSNAKARAAQTSLALSNLRAIVILIVVGFHSSLAYLNFLGPKPFAFDAPPYEWRAFPIIDTHRFLGFDIFCAWQDVYLMAFMFFMSALFTWPSLTRKGAAKFLTDRLLRLGVPFVFAVTVVVPLALYPTYRVSAADPNIMGYFRHYLALPFVPNGPEWFLWELLAMTMLAAGLHRFAPGIVALLGRVSTSAGAHPVRYFAGLVTVAILAYVPLALAFTPMAWIQHGPFGFQFSRPLLYGVFYFAGLGVGAFGLDSGLLAPGGSLARNWLSWLAAALASFVLWMALTAFAMSDKPVAPLALRILVNASFALACAGGCFCVLAACLRFGVRRSRAFDNLANNAFAIYLLHYVFVVWLQYALLGVAMFALAKGLIVLSAGLVLSWGAASALRRIPFGTLLIGEAVPARQASQRVQA